MNPSTKRQATASKGLYLLSGCCFWSLGVIWAVFETGEPMIVRYSTAGLCGAISAVAAVYFISLIASPVAIADANENGRPQPPVDQRNQNAPNFNVPGSGNNFYYYNGEPHQKSEERNPDGLYQLGRLVATVTGAEFDYGHGVVTFASIRSAGELNKDAEAEYRDLVITCPNVAGATPPHTKAAMFVGMTVGAECRIVRQR